MNHPLQTGLMKYLTHFHLELSPSVQIPLPSLFIVDNRAVIREHITGRASQKAMSVNDYLTNLFGEKNLDVSYALWDVQPLTSSIAESICDYVLSEVLEGKQFVVTFAVYDPLSTDLQNGISGGLFNNLDEAVAYVQDKAQESLDYYDEGVAELKTPTPMSWVVTSADGFTVSYQIEEVQPNW